MANWNIFDNSHGIHWAVSQSEMILRAHLLNWFWRPREERRVVRTSVTASCIDKYLDIYLPLIRALEPDSAPATAEPERLWSIWLQGEESAPPLVKACWRSVRHNCPSHNLVVLDSETVFDYITLPAKSKPSGVPEKSHRHISLTSAGSNFFTSMAGFGSMRRILSRPTFPNGCGTRSSSSILPATSMTTPLSKTASFGLEREISSSRRGVNSCLPTGRRIAVISTTSSIR